MVVHGEIVSEDGAVTVLADAVLPLIRTRADLYRWSASNAHGRQMHDAVDILERAIPTEDPAAVHALTHKALVSSIKVIARADDSDGIIGDACRRLLDLHPRTAAAARVPAGKLVDWMVKFQFEGEVDYFTLDPVAYAPALGSNGVESYRTKLGEIEVGLGPRPAEDQRWSGPHAHEWFALDWNARRLAVLDRDVEAIVRTHARDRKVAAWLTETARALDEIGQVDLALDWAKQATDFGPGHQSIEAAEYWCQLLTEHRPEELLDARLDVFRRWPSVTSASRLHKAASASWPNYRDEVIEGLTGRPRDAVLFALLSLNDTYLAWDLAYTLTLEPGHLDPAGQGLRKDRPARRPASPHQTRRERPTSR